MNVTDGTWDVSDSKDEDAFYGNSTGNAVSIDYTVILKGCIFSVLILLTMVGNSLVIFAISTNKSLQRPCNFFLASLAIADLGVGSMVMVPSAIDEVIGWWPFGPSYCQIFLAEKDRIVSIDLKMSAGFVSVFSGLYTTESVLDFIHDNPNVCFFQVNKIYSVVAAGISFWIPAVLMVYIYVRVYMEVVKLEAQHPTINNLEITSNIGNSMSRIDSFANLQQNSPSVHRIGLVNSPSPLTNGSRIGSMTCINARSNGMTVSMLQINGRSSDPKPTLPRQPRGADKSEAKAAVSLGFIMGGFLVCWLPFFIWMPLVHLMEIETPHSLYLYILWIGYLNSGINPIIYGLHHQEFKQIFSRYYETIKRKLTCRRCQSQVDHDGDKWV